MKPLPIPQPESDRFWEGARAGELWLRRCLDCRKSHHYPRDLCPECFSRNVEWFKASGHGRLFTFAIVHRAPHPAFEGDVPYVAAIVELDEGPKMATNVVGAGADPAALQIGMRLRAVYEKANDQVSLVKFTPA